jgi:epoxyqueuosine reductase QueG
MGIPEGKGREAVHSAEAVKRICLEAGADDAGIVDLEREGLEKEREGVLRVYPRTRSIVSIIAANNRENIQSPARYVANEEFHHTGDKISRVAREILRRLNGIGVRGVVVNKSWPMDLGRWPGKIWDVSHKVLAVEAGLGQMGLNRLVLHPRLGGFVQLDSILIDAEMDCYDRPLSENPCIQCNLCAVVCPTGAITKDAPFDFAACITHTYRDNMVGFQNWVEAMITSGDMAEYRSRFDDRETAFMWQSLMFRMSYRCSYCMAVCPAGEELETQYLRDKKAHVSQILKPLRDRVEPVYVMAGSKAESAAKRNPNKEVRIVVGMNRG